MSTTLFPAIPLMANILQKLLSCLRNTTARTNPPPSKTATTDCTTPHTAKDYRPNDTYHYLRHLTTSTEADLAIIRSTRTRKLLVLKHTKPRAHRTSATDTYPSEARILLTTLQGANHPNLIQLFGAAESTAPGSSPARWLLFLEYCSGGDLLDQLAHFMHMLPPHYESSAHLLLRAKPAEDIPTPHPPTTTAGGTCLVPEIFILHVFASLIKALTFLHNDAAAAHEAVIHGDIKPDNILLRWPPHPTSRALPTIVLADFGAAQLASQSRGVSGTPGYDSPEVHAVAQLQATLPRTFAWWCGRRVMTPRSDVYQLGHVMHLLASFRPWPTGADPATMALPKEFETGACRGVAATVAWCLAVEPGERPTAGGDLMPVAEVMGERRDRLFEARGALPGACWREAVVL
ncbi:hypothetical protein LTR08_005996 [Meristemomyces frigidus]|nr:hypothetical protein LTR08_005996 [Meristemomyces frigidus]